MTKQCSIEGCEKPHEAKGYCSKHYDRFRHHGSPHIKLKAGSGESLAWLKNAINQDTDECIYWLFYIGYQGYGRVTLHGTEMNAHRVALILKTGIHPPGSVVCRHKCRNRHCINPRHLEWGSQTDNMKDMIRDGTSPRGEKHCNTKLTEKQVLMIRDDNRTHKIIALDYGVSRTCITYIKNRRSWSYLK